MTARLRLVDFEVYPRGEFRCLVLSCGLFTPVCFVLLICQ